MVALVLVTNYDMFGEIYAEMCLKQLLHQMYHVKRQACSRMYFSVDQKVIHKDIYHILSCTETLVEFAVSHRTSTQASIIYPYCTAGLSAMPI